ncbi:hypothetical protein FOVSG1_013560 [Fusarium oxysporum f. sp. vasinfectum]
MMRKSGNLAVSYFIHGGGMFLQRTPLGVFRALLNSILISFPEYLSQLTERFNDKETRFGAYQENRWDWTEKELQEFLSEILIQGTKSRPVVIFVDALDECGDRDAKCLLGYFKGLMDDVERDEAQVKICFSSRHYPILGPDTISTISVEERNDKDIRSVIRERLKEIQLISIATRQQIEKEILLKAHGGFQWAVSITGMVIRLNDTGINEEKLYEMITTTPEALDELYTTILSGITEADKRQTTKLFQWVLFSGQPLSAQELREALATDKGTACTTVSELKRHDSWIGSLTRFEMHVRHISRGLVEFQTREIWEQYELNGEDSDREVQFIHQSVADYVRRTFLMDVGHEYASLAGACHFGISRSCLRYLTLREVLEGTHLSRGTISARFPLVPYVVRFVIYHIREAEREGIPQPDLLSIIRWDRHPESLGKIASLWRVMDPDNAHAPMGWPFVGATPLHILVALGSKSAFDALLQKDDVQVDGRDLDGNTPLLLALREGHQEMALVLLNRSIEWQHRHEAIEQSTTADEDVGPQTNHFVDVNAENNDGETSLTIALTEEAGEVIFKLIEAGADLKCFGQQTALVFYAIRNRNKPLLLKLLEKNAKLDGAVYFALKELSYKDDHVLKQFVSKLLKAGANTLKTPEVDKSCEDQDEDEDEDEVEAILLASRTGQRSMVSLLLSHGTPTTSRNKHGSTPLLLALQNGHEAVVRVLIENGADVNASSDDGSTPLSWASENGHEAVVKVLIENRADVNASNEDRLTPLWLASQSGHEAVVKVLIENGADVNTRNTQGSTPLFWASRNGHEAVVKVLIENRADVNASNEDRLTPLWLALLNGHEAVVKVLIKNGADVNASNKHGSAPLLWASENGHEAVVDVLIKNGADVNASSDDGSIPLSWASENGHEAVVKVLIENGADINVSSEDGSTPLWLASQNGHEVVVKVLIENEADVNASSEDGWTALFWASGNGHAAVAMLLIENGADVNAVDMDGWTTLFWALRNSHEAVIKVLIENEADVNARDKYGSTLLSWASENGHKAVVKVLIENEADVNASNEDRLTPLWLALLNGHGAVAMLLMENGADVNAVDKDGSTPVSWASRNGYKSVVKVLIENRADVNAVDKDGSTPVSWASRNGYKSVVKVLIENRADVNASNEGGWTPLWLASRKGHEAVVKVLIKNGADVNASSKRGSTPLSCASRNGHEAIAMLLIENGADINARYKDKSTPLFWASEKGHEAVVKVLIENRADVNAMDKYESTPLFWASRNGHEAVTRLLIEKGAGVNASSKRGSTPLSWASRNGHEAVVKVLIDNGAEVYASNKYGSTPISWASENGHEAVLKLLIEKGDRD